MTGSPPLELDQIVVLKGKPEWGPGRILVIQGTRCTIYFRDLPGDTPEGAMRTIDTTYGKLEPWPTGSDAMLDNLPPYRHGRFVRPPRARATIPAAIHRFEREYPLRFEDPRYLDEERNYKWAAHELFIELLGAGRGEELLAAGQVDEIRQRLLTVEGKVNLLASFEKIAFRAALQDDAAVVAFATTLLAAIAAGPDDRTILAEYLHAVESLPRPGNSSPAKWTIASLFPYLASPDRFMFLKPEVTQECAVRVMFDLQYTTELVPAPYCRLLEMSRNLLDQLRPLGARDFLDVQSFIWIIGTWDDPAK